MGAAVSHPDPQQCLAHPIGGPGAFMVPADSYDTFAEAILKKLITEIAEREARKSGG